MGQIWRQSEVTQFFASVCRVIDQKWSKSLTWKEVSERDSVEVEKKENPGRNIVVVCDNEVEKRRESRIPANTKVILHGRYVAGRHGPSNAM